MYSSQKLFLTGAGWLIASAVAEDNAQFSKEDIATMQQILDMKDQLIDITELTGRSKQGDFTDTAYVWLIVCVVLVFFMQAGFTLLEASVVRRKSSSTILLKNLLDTCVGVCGFWLLGWTFAFNGASGLGFNIAKPNDGSGIIGGLDEAFVPFFSVRTNADGMTEDYMSPKMLTFLFQSVFCCTASTIVSGGIAERVRIEGYIVYTFLMASFIFPVICCWCWNPQGWLWNMGYYDFAGCGVVHLTGGCGALVGAYVAGPRLGRSTARSMAQAGTSFDQWQPHNAQGMVLGVMILWFGWFGFNAGSGMAFGRFDGPTAALAATNTFLAPSSAIIWGIVNRHIVNKIRSKITHDHKAISPFNLADMSNCCLAGLVSITAACANVTNLNAIIIGCVGSMVYQSSVTIVDRVRIDDPLSAWSIHGACGMWGVIAAVLFDLDFVDGNFHGALGFPSKNSTGKTLTANIVGVVAILAFTLCVNLPVFYILGRIGLFKVSDEEQISGQDAMNMVLDIKKKLTTMRDMQGEVSKLLANLDSNEGEQRFQVFISHRKGTVGATARAIQLEFGTVCGGREQLFLDSDNLCNLGNLLDTIKHRCEALILLATKDFWNRTWCCSEFVVAMQRELPVVIVEMEAGAAADSVIKDALASFDSNTLAALQQYGISIEDVEAQYAKIDQLPILYFHNMSDWVSRDRMLLLLQDSLPHLPGLQTAVEKHSPDFLRGIMPWEQKEAKAIKFSSKDSDGTKKKAGILNRKSITMSNDRNSITMDTDVVGILSDYDYRENISCAHVLSFMLQECQETSIDTKVQNIRFENLARENEEETFDALFRCRCVVLIFTANTLASPFIASCVSILSKNNKRVVPIYVDGLGFQFPDSRWFETLSQGACWNTDQWKQMERCVQGIDHATVYWTYDQLFRMIIAPFAVFGTFESLVAQTRTILQRCVNFGDSDYILLPAAEWESKHSTEATQRKSTTGDGMFDSGLAKNIEENKEKMLATSPHKQDSAQALENSLASKRGVGTRD